MFNQCSLINCFYYSPPPKKKNNFHLDISQWKTTFRVFWRRRRMTIEKVEVRVEEDEVESTAAGLAEQPGPTIFNQSYF